MAPGLRTLAGSLLLALAFCCAPRLHAAPANDAVVTFNEIHYHPKDAAEAEEFVELVNVMGVDVDISGWRISGGVDFSFPDGTVIGPGATLLVAKDPGLFPNALGPFAGSLANSGETLRLRDNNDRAMDELTYGDGGPWPVAPDGSGVSLAKRDPFTNSAEPASWAPSTQAGGTPGASNFPLPPGPVTTRFINRFDSWKYHTSGSVPAGWNTAALDDSAWTSGPAGLHFGNPTIYAEPTTPVPGGQWFVKPWTGDADSEISAAKSYTHKVGFNRAGGYTAINGVTFDSPGSGVMSATNWLLTGAPDVFTNNGSGAGLNNLPAGSGSRQLCEEFFYGARNAGSTSRLQLAGLTPGQTYIATFYTTGFGPPGSRQVRITPSDTGTGYLVDENLTDSGNGTLVKYRYLAPGDGTMVFDFQDTSGATWHHYAFSNEVAPAMVIQSAVTGTSVAAFSSELSDLGFTRFAARTVDGSGMVNDQHGTTPDGTMWLSHGTFASGNDPLPAEITFDLGAVVDLAGVQVWNYNEVNNTARGAKQVVVQTAPAAGGDFTTVATLNFRAALGVASEPGERFDLPASGVRQVKFIINSTHGGDQNFAGLSEVKFFKQGLPPPGAPQLLKEGITTIFNSGVGPTGVPAVVGSNDLHWMDVVTGQPAIVMIGNAAWFGLDGSSLWIGSTSSGNDSVPAGQSRYRTTFDLTNYEASQAAVSFQVGADNSLDDVVLNGVAKGLSAGGFSTLLGPFTINGPFNAGANTVDFLWSNASAGPGGLRVKWDATAPPKLAKTALSANPVTTYLRRTFTHTGNPASSYLLLLNFIADDGAIFYLNGTEVHRTNMPSGAVSNTTLASSDIVYPKFNGAIEVPAGALLPGQPNVLAVELHQSSAANADAFFLATLDIQETAPATVAPTLRINEIGGAQTGPFFVEIQNTGAAAMSLNGWQVRSSSGRTFTFGATNLAAGALLSVDEAALGFHSMGGEKLFLAAPDNGISDAVLVTGAGKARSSTGAWLVPNAATPGTANTFTLNTSVVINEIMYNHAPAYLATGTTPSPEEWVELYNRTASPVLLTGWRLRGLNFEFPAGTQIAAHSYLVVSNNPAALLAKFPGITVVGPSTGSLSNSDDAIRLEDASGNPGERSPLLRWGRWDERADGGGSELWNCAIPTLDNSVPEAWAASDEAAKRRGRLPYSGTGAPSPAAMIRRLTTNSSSAC